MPTLALAVPDPLPAASQGFKRRRITGKRQLLDTAGICREKASTAASSSTSHTDALHGRVLTKINTTTSDGNSTSPLSVPSATESSTQHPLTRKQLMAQLTDEVAQRCHLMKRPRLISAGSSDRPP